MLLHGLQGKLSGPGGLTTDEVNARYARLCRVIWSGRVTYGIDRSAKGKVLKIFTGFAFWLRWRIRSRSNYVARSQIDRCLSSSKRQMLHEYVTADLVDECMGQLPQVDLKVTFVFVLGRFNQQTKE